MTAPTAPAAPAPWLLAHATACAEAVATALDLLDADEIETEIGTGPDATGDGFTLRVLADPPREVRALRWSAARGWELTADSALRRTPRWRSLALPADAEPVVLCEVLRGA